MPGPHEEPSPRTGGSSIPRRRDSGPWPLSFAQQRLWFLNQLEPESTAYNQPKAVQLKGPLNIEALKKALDFIVARHEVFRTTFSSSDGQPVQIIADNRSLDLSMVDLSGIPAFQRRTDLKRVILEIAERPFDLSRDVMLRAALLRLDLAEHVLLLVQHHIASDGWSSRVLFREVAALYQAFCNNLPSPLPDLPIQYADYAVWQRQWLQGTVLQRQLGYWKQRLGGNLSVLQIPADRPKRAVQRDRGASQETILSGDLAKAVKDLSRRNRVTLFMTLLAAFQALLCRYTGEKDILIGVPIANRTRVELEPLIGFFANTLVLRTDLSGNPRFHELLGQVREVALGAYANQDLPFEKLVEELNPDRDLSRNPLFQVTFSLQNPRHQEIDLGELTLSSLTVHATGAKFDLGLAVMDSNHQLRTTIEYNADLFEVTTITRMLNHYRTLLESIVANPEQRLSDLSLLTPAEREQILIGWNDTQSECPTDKSIHELFEAQVERSPQATALVLEDRQLTYRELNRRANQLAHYLRKLGVGPEVSVGICMERSLDMIVGLLAILKAGGAYVPLDPDYPQHRLSFLIEDSRASVLLTEQRLLENLPEHKSRVICMDTDRAISKESEENPVRAAASENLAYIIYTSGSTGIPKGVLISHGSITQHSIDAQARFELKGTDRALQFTMLNFDASLEEILPALISGATLVLRDAEIWSPEKFWSKLSHLQITIANLPTAYWHEVTRVTDAAAEAFPPQLRLVIVGGEAMSPTALSVWQQKSPTGVRFFNGYGPTETTITATMFDVPPGYSVNTPSRSIPIGRPFGNRRTYILDRHGNIVPIGITGELHIAGSFLARGYLNRPEMTAEKFIPDPFSTVPGARLYKTGDLVRYLADGNIEFLGRKDDQVKIRGFRIEPGETEAALGQHPDIQQVVVIAREDAPGDKRLVAYVVPNRQSVPPVDDLCGFLRVRLPNYMIPSGFVMMDALPVTANGKVNRRALPAPDQGRPDLKEIFVAPRSPVEQVIVKIWAKLLKLEQLGVNDNFFDLGGHSLLATQVISRLHAAFQVEIPLRDLFENPTVAGLALQIKRLQVKSASNPVADMLADIESLSDEEAEHLLSQRNT